MFTRIDGRPRILSPGYLTAETISYEKEAELQISLENLIKEKSTWGVLYAVVCVTWLERMLPPKKEFSKKSHTNIAIQFEVEREFESLLWKRLFEKVIFSQYGHGDKKLLTVMNLSDPGKALGNELFTRSNSMTLEHFYCSNKIPQEATTDEPVYYKYEPCDSEKISRTLKNRLDNDWFMQYLLQSPGAVLEATHFSQEELREDLFVQYIANHVKELYLFVDPKLYPNTENPRNIKNRKQLFWR